ncbi:MAG: glycosyltransferase family 1 protein [Phycisphaerales bacterium]|nr:glycosyltransferase family 1 protein [Phycisphaerales bacterium]
MKLALFTDTLADVNGVSRFVNAAGEYAFERSRSMRVFTCTDLPMAARPWVTNLKPVFASRMPGYANLRFAVPSPGELAAAVCDFAPDVVHVSTPGPVGLLGRRWAMRNQVPLAGTYHTDFPAYIARLFNDEGLGTLTTRIMSWFYRPFECVLTRSTAYLGPVRALGVSADRSVALRFGVDLARFSPMHRDEALLRRLSPGVGDGPRVLYCGRVSFEKNVRVLASAWRMLETRWRKHETSPLPALVVVGDGPALGEIRESLRGCNASMLGFRSGHELSSLIASCDLLAFPSTTDTLGQSVLEAQASGLAAVVSHVGGPAEVVVDSQTGVVVRSTAPEAWAHAMYRVLRDPTLLSSMKRRACTHAEGLDIRDSLEHFWTLNARLARSTTATSPANVDQA